MKVGYMGLGKLGLPVALATEARGFEVKGSDPNPSVRRIIESRKLPYMEEGAQELLDKSKIEVVLLAELVQWADLIFVAIQTPHEPTFEGEHPVRDGHDFDYTYLLDGLDELSAQVDALEKDVAVAIISTCRPGTFNRLIRPILSSRLKYVYNPYFIAMGTTIQDFYHPEFVLLGTVGELPHEVREFYEVLSHTSVPWVVTDPTTAELVKMSYNTFIGQKIIFANSVMEIADKLNADADTVTYAMSLATRRLISPAYLNGGMGDGGGCHPRDNVALWCLAEDLYLSYNIFADMMNAREYQTRWLAERFISESHGRPLVILGESYKPETNLTIGSPSRLLSNLLWEMRHPAAMWDPYTSRGSMPIDGPTAYFVATKHEFFKDCFYPFGSVVVDPWRYVENQEGIKVIRIGERRA